MQPICPIVPAICITSPVERHWAPIDWALSSMILSSRMLAIFISAFILTHCPNRCTGIIARVLGESEASISSSFIRNVLSSTSTTIGLNPSSAMTSTLATNVNEGTMTSSPCCRSRHISAIWRASVPFAQEITWAPSKYSLSFASSSLTSFPWMKAPLSIHSRIRASISSLRSRYWRWRSTMWIACMSAYMLETIFLPMLE